jgi:hypothetical protein
MPKKEVQWKPNIQGVVQSAGTTPHEAAEVTNSNPSFPLLCGHVKKKKKKLKNKLKMPEFKSGYSLK